MSQVFARLVLWLFGLDPSGVVRLDEVRAGLLHGATGLFLAIVGAGVVLAAVCYLRTTESITKRMRLLLALLRVAAIALVGFALLTGVVRFHLQRNVRQVVAFAVDGTGSMNVPDVNGQTRFEAALDGLRRNAGLGQLSDTYDIHFYRLGLELREMPFEVPAGDAGASAGPAETSANPAAPAAAPAGDTADAASPAGHPDSPWADGTEQPMGLSPLWANLADIASKYEPKGLRTVVVLSDGRDTSDREWDPSVLRSPVIAVPVGQNAVKDVRIGQVDAPDFVYAGDPIVLEATIEHIGLAERTVGVVLTVDGKEVPGGKREVTLGAGREAQRVQFDTQQRESGLKRLTVRALPLEDEATALNNEQSVYVDVRPESIRVLYVEGELRWEYRHIKDVLMTDPAVEGTFLVRVTGDDWLCQGGQTKGELRKTVTGAEAEQAEPKEGDAPDNAKKKPEYVLKDPARGFPKDRLELFQFDVLILGDVSRKYLEGAPLQNIFDFVKERGGGLATLGGFHVYSAGNYQTSLLNQMLPVIIQDEDEDQFEERFRAFPTPVGQRHAAMRLEFDATLNRKVWDELPVLEGGNVLTKARPGAVVLARHDTENDRIILATHKFFEGRVLSSAVDSTHRWRLGRESEDKPDYMRRFWSVAVRWLAKNPHLRGSSETLFPDVNQFHLGSPVTLMTRMVDKDYNPVEDVEPEFTVKSPSGRVTRYLPRASMLTPGLYSCQFVPGEAGQYDLSVKRPRPDGSEGIAQMSVVVEENPRELESPSVNEAELKSLAEATGGQVLPLRDIGRLADVLGPPTAQEAEVRTLEFRRSWTFFGLLVFLLSAEWFFRKRRGLA